jgi:hypothetical protein
MKNAGSLEPAFENPCQFSSIISGCDRFAAAVDECNVPRQRAPYDTALLIVHVKMNNGRYRIVHDRITEKTVLCDGAIDI